MQRAVISKAVHRGIGRGSMAGFDRGVVVLTACLLAASCVGPSTRAREADRGPALTVHGVMAPVGDDAASELVRLRQLPETDAIALRRAYVFLEVGSSGQAMRELQRVLFAEIPPSPQVESFALLLRSRANDQRGDPKQAAADLARAGELATTPDLRGAIAAAQPTPTTGARARHVAVLDRSSWHAAAARKSRMVPMTAVHRITIHHSAMLTRPGSAKNAAASVRAIQKAHMSGNGWGDIGYHFLIDASGRVWTGRQIRWQGAHAGDASRNKGNIGICLLGNFVRQNGGQSPSRDQLTSLERLTVELSNTYGVAPDGIYTHRELRATACPGDRLQVAVERLRRGLANVAAAPPAL